jgi:pimeloyl-[acyl-carrier protein] methyl ester esterase
MALSGSALYCESSGGGDTSAEPLVLLHGWAMNLRVFDALRAALGARPREQHRVTAIDLPGHGRSGWSPRAGPREQLGELAAILPRGATLVGWSLGGQLALQLASDASLSVRRLVLIASSPRFVGGDDWPHGLPGATLQRFAAQLERNVEETVADFIELQARGSADAAGVRATLRDALQRHGAAHRDALAAGLIQLEHNDLRALARRIDVPTLLIAGQYDRVTPPAASQALAQLLPRSQLLQIRRAGHAPMVSHPEEVGAALLAFMDQHARHRQAAGARLAP